MGHPTGTSKAQFLDWKDFIGCCGNFSYCGGGECGGIFAANIGASNIDNTALFPDFWEQTINVGHVGGMYGNSES